VRAAVGDVAGEFDLLKEASQTSTKSPPIIQSAVHAVPLLRGANGGLCGAAGCDCGRVDGTDAAAVAGLGEGLGVGAAVGVVMGEGCCSGFDGAGVDITTFDTIPEREENPRPFSPSVVDGGFAMTVIPLHSQAGSTKNRGELYVNSACDRGTDREWSPAFRRH
jgi:hypothetical protein